MKNEKVTIKDFASAGVTLVFAIVAGFLIPVFFSVLTNGV